MMPALKNYLFAVVHQKKHFFLQSEAYFFSYLKVSSSVPKSVSHPDAFW